MLTLTEDLVLLALDDHSGRILPVDDIGYRHALAGAVLLDLKCDRAVAVRRRLTANSASVPCDVLGQVFLTYG